MNASSDAYRYYIMRNRAYLAKYYRAVGVYQPLPSPREPPSRS